MVFDLDYTLWDLWIDTHISPPLKRHADDINHLTDSLDFYPEVPGILKELKERRIHIAIASRTGEGDLAREALSLLLVPDIDGKIVRSSSYFQTMEIYPSSKLKHFKAIHKKTGIPYEEMLFFDDEHRNFEVESLGVTMQFITDGTGRKAFNEGLALWRKRRGIKIVSKDSLAESRQEHHHD
ncbi:uncharacterized protein EHS24_001472 [Apiotrichum porosum]|uniref:Magnesium-dependent phosphatase-1 n=1 Tax=Apiotrichum porosum TaxID=105984 RepID=A0A427XKK7_9TREE|nr:uncharacterized protein EHS24_001472 [Apiotrichum porosum]RSH79425.1 hypothetical protein EHS24_001472 [Apiotrichum porosum]